MSADDTALRNLYFPGFWRDFGLIWPVFQFRCLSKKLRILSSVLLPKKQNDLYEASKEAQ